MICNEIGYYAKTALDKAGITLYCGVNGDVDVQIDDYLKERLKHNPNTSCNYDNNYRNRCNYGNRRNRCNYGNRRNRCNYGNR